MRRTPHPADETTLLCVLVEKADVDPLLGTASIPDPQEQRSIEPVRPGGVRYAEPKPSRRRRSRPPVRMPETNDNPPGDANGDIFIAMLSHELRSPVTTIGGNAHLLRSRGDELSEEQRTQALADIDDEANRLRELIEDLMILAQPSHPDALNGQFEPTLVHRVAEQVIQRHLRDHPERRITLAFGEDVPAARAVPRYVYQVLENFVTNAEKYSAPGDPIELAVEGDATAVRITVLDRGHGIDPADVTRIFSPFYRGRRDGERVEGTGIGLAVCKRLMEAQGGGVWARLREGGGSEFGAWLPTYDAKAL